MIALLAAFLLDLSYGDPEYRAHPVRLMGLAIARGEDFLRKRFGNLRSGGALLAFALPGFVFTLSWGLIALAGRVHWSLGWLVNVFGIYSAVSVHDLRREALRIYADLGQGDLERARRDTGRIAGRDTDGLSREEVIRAAVESVGESTLDGIVAPIFYAALGGAPLALAYKAVNTLDSMIGHQNERYRDFGFFSAKLDEAVNWIPARVAYSMISAAAFFVNRRMPEALYVGWEHGVAAGNGNGAIAEAAFAGALGLRLGGINFYQGRKVEKPYLGFSGKDFDREDILRSVRLMSASAWVSVISMMHVSYGLELLFGFLRVPWNPALR